MRKYEIMYILRADLDETARAAEMEKVHKILTDNGAEITKVDESMGLREFAYEIQEQKKGYYVVLKVTAEQSALNEFARLVGIDSNVLRHLVVVDHD